MCASVCPCACVCEHMSVCVSERVYVMNKNLCMVQKNVNIKSLVSTASGTYRCSHKPKLQTFTDQYNVQIISQNGDTMMMC